MVSKNIKPKKKEKEVVAGYNPTGDEQEVFDNFIDRKQELLKSRKSVYGIDIDEQMRRFDNDYFNRVADIPPSELDPNQQPVAINNAFGKMQTALSILMVNNPDYLMDESEEKYSANRELMKALMKKSWKRSGSFYQFLLMTFNTAKRGWGVGRTYHRFIQNEARFLSGYNEKGKPQYETRKVTKMDEIGLLALDNLNTWIDEETRPYDFFSTRDWMWREVWSISKVKETFPEKEYPNMKYVSEGGNTDETIEGDTTIGGSSTNASKSQKKGMTELFFYENQYRDEFIVEVNGIMVVWEPLPQDHKRLSLALIPGWNLRGADTIYNIGIIEEMEVNELLIDRILNMTLRQLLLSIAPMGFYSGTEDMENENMRIEAGVLKRMLNPNDINFLKIPGPGTEGMSMVEWLENHEDSDTGITKTLEGDIANFKASDKVYAMSASREASLKRLSLPLKSMQYCLDWESRNRSDLIKQVYSVFDVEHIANESDILAYLAEVKKDPTFYFIENEGVKGEEKFYKNKFKESKLNIEQDESGKFIESENEKFFKIKPERLSWEGDIWVDIDKILISSEELEKLDTIRMTNILTPLLQQDPRVIGKTVKQILLAFNKDPKKWLPNEWLVELYPVRFAEMKQKMSQPKTVPTQTTEHQNISKTDTRPPTMTNQLIPRK